MKRGQGSKRQQDFRKMPAREPASISYGHGKRYQSLLNSLNSDSRPSKRQRTTLHQITQPTARTGPYQQRDESASTVVDDQASDNVAEDEVHEGDDPFHVHFENPSAQKLSSSIAAIKESKWISSRQKGETDWSFLSVHPNCQMSQAVYGDVHHGSRPSSKLPRLALKRKLRERAMKDVSGLDPMMDKTCELIFRYEDVCFPSRTCENAHALRQVACIHTLNHLLKTRDRIIKNNGWLSKNSSEADIEVRDQGFTRPKALILLPTRQACVRYADILISLYNPEQQENKKRFQDSFSSPAGDLADNKPDDFRELFEGNDDDLFRLGIKFTRKTVKFFSKFYNSDIILASPLGLRMAMGKGENKTADYDFLSSIEILLLDQADALYMQNWEHVEFIIDHMGLQPREAHGCDFSRVRHWYLDGNAKFVRQTIALSSYNFAQLNQLFTSSMSNFAGKHKMAQETEGMIAQLSIMPKQTFSRFRFGNVKNEPDERFKYFTQAVLPKATQETKSSTDQLGLLVFVPAYADFLRVRNYMAAAPDLQDVSFGAISEYTPVKDVARARTHFLSGRHSILLYTERVHHFRRYHLKGAKRIVMYALPETPTFYKELVEGFLSSSLAVGKVSLRELDVKVLFSRLDVLKIERTVGSERYQSLLNEDGDTFDFVS